MYCQKCRSPLKSDNSLDTLNPAAFDLLVGRANFTIFNIRKTNTRVGSSSKPPRKAVAINQNYPQERRNLYNTTSDQSQNPIYRRSIPAPKSEDETNRGDSELATLSQLPNPGMSFIEITKSQIVHLDKAHTNTKSKSKKSNLHKDEVKSQQESLSGQIRKHERLFSILSSHSDIDHPICVECSSILISQLNFRLVSSTRERDAYASFLKSLQQTSNQSNGDPPANRDLELLVMEERKAFDDLIHLENEKRKLEVELGDLEEESRMLDDRERAFWEVRNAFDGKLHGVEVELISLEEKYSNDQKQLERLQRTNVYNDTFCIGHDGYFGTINNLRLGRLSSQNVEWAEINAAWGQTLLLLVTVAERIGFQFQGYRLRPLGSTSRIEKLEWPQQSPDTVSQASRHPTMPLPKVTQLDLFSSGDMPLGRVFNHRRFDAGMVAFLDCLSQLGKYVEKASKPVSQSLFRGTKPNTLVLPYVIQGDKIGDVSIRLGAGFSQDENFTKACKYTLTCCKFLLAHVSNLEGLKGG
jgi:beclin 1